MDISQIDPHTISKLNAREFQAVVSQVLSVQENERRDNALLYYEPVSNEARKIHLSEKQTIGVGGGNGSAKTESCLVDMIISCTGVMPYSLRFDEELWEKAKNPAPRGRPLGVPLDPIALAPDNFPDFHKKFRGPINCRVVCESLTNVLHQVILPKLQWWQWTGIDQPGGKRGHYGWVPHDCLIGGSWDKSWSEKLRTLRILCRDPNDNTKVLGESRIQFMSHDQDSTDFASGDYHIVLHDEPPKHAIWVENQARTMRVRGRMFLAMTWPDDPAIAVDWLFDKVYEPAMRAGGNPNVDWFNLYTTDNPNIDQEAVALQVSEWDDETAKVRIYGQPIRFSNRVHELFTDQDQTWCFSCGRSVVTVEGKCATCQSGTLAPFNHVADFEPDPNWPSVWLLDPHPRKPHMYSWWQIDPKDDLWCVADGECDGDPTDVANDVFDLESRLGVAVRFRYIDPNMGRSPASTKRGITWQDEFEAAGLRCDLPDDSAIGRKRIDEYLRPDKHTLAPRMHWHRQRCAASITQMKRYVWDDHKKALEKSQKQLPKDKNDDYPTLAKYLLNTNPEFSFLVHGPQVFRRMGGSRENRR